MAIFRSRRVKLALLLLCVCVCTRPLVNNRISCPRHRCRELINTRPDFRMRKDMLFDRPVDFNIIVIETNEKMSSLEFKMKHLKGVDGFPWVKSTVRFLCKHKSFSSTFQGRLSFVRWQFITEFLLCVGTLSLTVLMGAWMLWSRLDCGDGRTGSHKSDRIFLSLMNTESPNTSKLPFLKHEEIVKA